MADGKKIIAENRKARFNYFIEDSIECGIELRKLFYQNSLLAIGLSGSVAVPLPCVPPFLFIRIQFLCIFPVPLSRLLN
ncbi:SsrA-binding protein [Treponema sp. Marseille-Q4132]|uniref:SsrA-binding protein n=1 Tax=Treponema sp. Marseille-Q4132 TaxID=2766701 RepID=UPI001652D9EF|nr:SsrA-binding protein [Treponema sp. Marseille-Q4132]QNL97722.1 SsrA-binding protein [Treponema sp. Marseille-Q4132]